MSTHFVYFTEEHDYHLYSRAQKLKQFGIPPASLIWCAIMGVTNDVTVQNVGDCIGRVAVSLAALPRHDLASLTCAPLAVWIFHDMLGGGCLTPPPMLTQLLGFIARNGKVRSKARQKPL